MAHAFEDASTAIHGRCKEADQGRSTVHSPGRASFDGVYAYHHKGNCEQKVVVIKYRHLISATLNTTTTTMNLIRLPKMMQ